MCGIVGACGTDGMKAVEEMLDAVGHRGPDGRGTCINGRYALGHTRLAIVDIAGGAQPMHDDRTNADIAYNGEIYNHRGLRRLLPCHEFRTNSDTETLLALEGSGLERAAWLRGIEGMFAFAIASPKGILLARDPLGIKPLYIGRRGKRLVFASEIKAIARAADTIAAFPPGHVYSSGQGAQPYFELAPGPPEVRSPEAARRGVLRRLVRSVRASMTADVPVGAFLSGGLDSSLIASIATKLQRGLHTFAVGVEGSRDLEYARRMAGFLHTRHHERTFTTEEALRALPEVIYALESFDCALVRSAVPSYFLAGLASRFVKVALSGEGADELFAGYDYLRPMPPRELGQELAHITRELHNTNLQRCDRMGMAHGLEVRVPFLDDPELLRFAFSLSTDVRMRGSRRISKWVLRLAARGLVPREIACRPKEKFALGAGIAEHLARHAESSIGDTAFEAEREVGDGFVLRSKEELLYYRIFRRQFPTEKVLPLIGRSRSL